MKYSRDVIDTQRYLLKKIRTTTKKEPEGYRVVACPVTILDNSGTQPRLPLAFSTTFPFIPWYGCPCPSLPFLTLVVGYGYVRNS